MTDLHVHLDAPLPAELAVGAGTAVFVAGWCTAGDRRIDSLALVVDGEEQPVGAHGMPRLDVLRALGEPASYRSGFWGMVTIRRAPVELALRARLEGGGLAEATLGGIPAAELPAPVQADARVAIAMATFEPPTDLLRRQLDSIRAQTFEDWVCVISDDCSDPEHFAAIEAAVEGDPRFVVSRSPRRLGFYRNFERALHMVPQGAAHVTLADQDDVWHPDKLETLLARLGDAQLVYSDARVVDRDGTVVADTYWSQRRNNHEDLWSLLVANAVTGAASLLRREVLDVALPFPPAQFTHFHDHWLALCASILGDIDFVDRPLYDYTQHGGAVIGHAAANRVLALRERLMLLRRDPRDRIRRYRATYFVDVARLAQMATVLLLRAGDRMPPAKRRVLEEFLASEQSVRKVARLWLRGAREYVGRPETMGAERGLAYALVWRRLVEATARDTPQAALRLDAVPPDTFTPQPGMRTAPEGAARVLADKIAPLTLAVRDDAPERVNVLIPTVDLEHLFAGYVGKFSLARRLAERGSRVRLVTIDPLPALPPDWRALVERYEGLSGLFDRVEVAFGREPGGLEVSRADRFVATTWRTAHVAHAAGRELGRDHFLYLVQEYEPYTVPVGSWAALAEETYRFPHTALFSTELLREHFRRRRLGVYAGGEAEGDAASASFRNAITSVAPAPAGDLASRWPRQLLFYARPEPHAARNLFELGVLGLGRAAAQGVFRDGWLLRGIGTTSLGRRLSVGGGAELELLPRAAQSDYARILREHDVGLALMHTPHPSLVPIEMAAAGLVTVTSAFGPKTPEAMSAISPNILTAEPTVEGVAAALAAAVEAAADVERRIAGSVVDWARNWDDAFDDALMATVEDLLGARPVSVRAPAR